LISFFRIVGFLLLLILLALIFWGVYSPSLINIEQTQHFAAPNTTIWQLITNPEKTSRWLDITENANFIILNDSVFQFYEDTIKVNTFIICELKENEFFRLKYNKSHDTPLINNYNLGVQVKSLRDKTTEINCQITYNLSSITGKIANIFYFEGQQRNLLQQGLGSLKKYLEKM